MNKPLVLFILHMPPPVHGAAMMGKYIHDSKLINEKFDCHYINLATAKNLEDIGKFGLGKLCQFMQLLLHIFNTVRHLKPALVYVTPNAKGGAFLKDFMVVELLKMLGCKIVLHYHNKGVASYQHKTVYNMLYKHFFKNVTVILLARNLYQDIRKYIPEQSVFYCPNGIPTANIDSSKTDMSDCPHVLFLSNLLIEKGVLDVVEACKILKERQYKFFCDIVGGETTDINAYQFRSLIKDKGLQDVAFYHGKLYNEHKERIIRKSDIFVFPTYYNNECFPLVLLEAMQQSKVCISTDEGGIPDIIENNVTGYIINKHDPEMLAEKIATLLVNPSLRKQMGNAGYEKYCELFTLDKFEKNICSVLSHNLQNEMIKA